MKVIKSNKIGSRIHSPFVYRLVANVLFAGYPYYAFQEIEKLTDKKGEVAEYQFIFRLVNYFQPEAIQYIGNEDNRLKKVCSLAKKNVAVYDIQSFGSEGKTLQLSGGKDRLVIWNNYCEIKDFEITPEIQGVWIIRNIKSHAIKDFFNKLMKHQDVTITIRLGHLGIVIFNGQFQKQNYVIKY
ncbi:hypothetical protein MNBD_BACTEROID01-937 [hydrothermal vent metagenome]|uniref:Uncharacterized protein n=1 Tax=hydrothermal vent metagenome TaxID=652676 RepID=A0A3B0U7T5_9ZZZZ